MKNFLFAAVSGLAIISASEAMAAQEQLPAKSTAAAPHKSVHPHKHHAQHHHGHKHHAHKHAYRHRHRHIHHHYYHGEEPTVMYITVPTDANYGMARGYPQYYYSHYSWYPHMIQSHTYGYPTHMYHPHAMYGAMLPHAYYAHPGMDLGFHYMAPHPMQKKWDSAPIVQIMRESF